jgi:hypothetical protein
LRTKPLAYLLDDNLKVRELVSRMLAKCGFIPCEFTDMNACTRQIKILAPAPNLTLLFSTSRSVNPTLSRLFVNLRN